MSEPSYRMPVTVAVTGAMGFVASRLLPRLFARGVRVLALVRPGRDTTGIPAGGTLEFRHGDLAEPATLRGAFAGAEAVVHLAGLSLVPSLLPAAVADGVRAGVFVSSAGVHTKLKSGSADAKRAGEQALRDSPLAYTILRPSMIYGTPRDRNMIRLLRWIERFPVVPSPLGGITPQQPVHVDDLVAAILAALERPAAARGEYEVGGPEPIALRDVIHTCARTLGRRAYVLPIPLGPAHAAAVWARRWKLPFPVRPEQVLRLTESKAVDIAPARRDLGFEPRSFAQGIAEEVAMLREGSGRT
ncbi:MAG: NAD(P)H-binding protein [Candidatus Eisenbacteria bacterium]